MLLDFGVDLCCFLEASGLVLLVFATLETGLKTNGFLKEQGPRAARVARLNDVEFRAYKQLNSRQLIADSMTGNC